MQEFRPIALCNVSYKIISKVLVNRLKEHLPSIVSEYQNAFIPGRLISDNIVVAHEIFHSLKARKRQANSYMAVKTDITKAYDRLEWGFLQEAMKTMGFGDQWIQWIMECVSTVSYSVLINGRAEGHIVPERGLRQGDPLSPYLFILCAEVLSHMMSKAMEDRSLLGIKVALTAPAVNHLLFADDSLFFSLANDKAAKQLKGIFSIYEAISGQSINLRKSSVLFGSKVREEVKTRMRNILGIHNEGGIGKYLGLPEQFSSKKSEMFAYIVDKVKQATQGWKQRHLSQGGNEVLLKAVSLAMPIFSMNIFRLPKEVCDEINSVLSQFWWGSGDKKGLHWYSWNRVSIPKREGGLGFKDLEAFNQALLAKQVWRILQNPTCLMARILQARYFPEGDILNAKLRAKSSYAWKSILYGKELLHKGMRYIIGDGTQTNMWTDCWLPTHPPRPPRSRGDIVQDSKVQNYLMDDRKSWNMVKIRAEVVDEDCDMIEALKISDKAQQDLMGWHYNEDGLYTVRSGYWLATHLPDQPYFPPTYGNVNLKQRVWKTKTPSKIQHFLWKSLSRCLATGSNLKRRHIINDSICKRCFLEEETEDHLFFGCLYAKQIWRASGIHLTVFNDPMATLEDKIKACFDFVSSTRLAHFQNLPIWILWNIWKSRNRLFFQQKSMHWRTVLRYARNDAQEWKEIDLNEDRGMRHIHRQHQYLETQKRWQVPPQGSIKCNVDGSFLNENVEATAGWLYRNDDGQFKGAIQAKGRKVGTALESELQAILMAMQHCWSQGHRKIIIESDCKKAVDIINNKSLHFALYNWTREIRWWKQKFPACSVQWIGREGNKPADKLATSAHALLISFQYYYYVPYVITNLLHEDYIVSRSA